MFTRKRPIFSSLVLLSLVSLAVSAENRIDRVRPDAPELAAFGSLAIGVQTLAAVHPDQVDVIHTKSDGEPPRYDRPLPLEVWYPAVPGGEPTRYEVFLRDGETAVQVHGRATRNALPESGGAPYPLIVISHGYPGNRYLLSHLGENLASKGYVVVSIDHTDSTYRTRAAFASTLVNRSLDQLFVVDFMTQTSTTPGGFFEGLIDTSRTGLIGYSMGGYGAVITSGGGLTASAVASGAPQGILATHLAGSHEHAAHFDDRIKAVVGFAPWGMERGMWDAVGLAGIKIPTFYIAGSADEVSGYDQGTREIFEQAVNTERYLLTFENAGHNAAAPMPAPDETLDWQGDGPSPFSHYADSVWDTTRMNNIAQHFLTAWFAKQLKDDESMDAYLDLIPDSGDGVWAVSADGTELPENTYWKGFQNRTAQGLKLERLAAQ